MADSRVSVHAIYCEDLRREISGFATYVGVMPPRVPIKPLPILIPKLVVVLSIMADPSLDLGAAEASVLMDGDAFMTSSLSDKPMPSLPRNAASGATLFTYVILEGRDLAISIKDANRPPPAEIVIVGRFRCAEGEFFSNPVILAPNHEEGLETIVE